MLNSRKPRLSDAALLALSPDNVRIFRLDKDVAFSDCECVYLYPETQKLFRRMFNGELLHYEPFYGVERWLTGTYEVKQEERYAILP